MTKETVSSVDKVVGVATLLQYLLPILKVCTSVQINGSLWEGKLFGPSAIINIEDDGAIDLNVGLVGVIVSRQKTVIIPKTRIQKIVYEKEDRLNPVIIVSPIVENRKIVAIRYGAVLGEHSSPDIGFALRALPCKKEIDGILKLMQESLPNPLPFRV